MIVLTLLVWTLGFGSNNAVSEVMNIKIPQELKEIPNEYFRPSSQPGTLVELYYDTYESFSYSERSKTLKKRAIVYLPYGYDKNRK